MRLQNIKAASAAAGFLHNQGVSALTADEASAHIRNSYTRILKHCIHLWCHVDGRANLGLRILGLGQGLGDTQVTNLVGLKKEVCARICM